MNEERLKELIAEYGGLMIDDEYGRANQRRDIILAAFAELRAERDLLREAVEKVEYEWDGNRYVCPWCGNCPNNSEHKPDCLRQRALGVKP